MTQNNTRPIGAHHDDPVTRVATGIKTALIVCVVGFIALVANRALVTPGAPTAADIASRPAAMASDVSMPAVLPTDGPAAQPALPVDGGAQFEGGDNHPPTF